MIAKLTGKDNLWMRLIRAAVLVVMAVVLMMSFTTTAFADDEHDKDFSFYRISSAASMHYDDAHNKASDNYEKFVADNGGNISMADAGAFVGFIDEDYGDGFIGSTVSFFSSSQQTRTYSSFEEGGLRQYVEYGHALKSLGLDSTANESLDIGAIVRQISGRLLTFLYIGSVICEQFFGFIIKVLQFTNPFALFGKVIDNLGGWMADMLDMSGDLPTVEGMYTFAGFSGLKRFVESWYDGLYDMGFALAVIIFAVTLGVAIMTYKSQQNKVKSVIRLFITRIAFLMVGIPLLGMTYTVTLDLAADFCDTTKNPPAANQVLMSTLVDFESWATEGNLALPAGTKITVNLEGDLAGSLDMNNTTSPRDLARRINSLYSPTTVYTHDGSSQDWTVDFWGTDNKGKSSVEGALDVIDRYRTSAFYHASDYETAYKKMIRETKGDDEEKKFFETIRDKTGKYEEYAKDGMSLTNDKENIPYLWNGRNDGYGVSDDATYSGGDSITFTGQTGGSESHNMGLSSLSMYNYLTTVFSDSSVETYSPMKITSKMAVHSHRSVNTVGDGAMSALYFINMLAMFFSISIIGLGYAFGLLINMFGRGVKMISSVPFSLLGNMRAMAKVCTVVAMMCVEVLMTFFVYSLVVELLISLQGLIEAPMAELLNGSLSTSTILAGGVPSGILLPIQAITAAGTLIMTVFYFVFGLKALKWRKSIVKAVDESVAGLVDRIFTPNPNGGAMSNAGGAGTRMATKPSLGDKVKDAGRAAGGAVMAGAGMAAGQMLATKAGDKLGLTAGSVDEEQKDGTAENAGGADQEDIADGGQIQGAERQGLPGSDGPDGTRHALPAPPSDGDDHTGQAIMAADVESLGDVRTDEVNGVQAGESAQPGEVGHETTNVAVSDDDVAQVDASSADAKQAAVDTELSRAAGQTTAMEDERDDELKSKERKAAAKDAVKGVAKTAEGGAKVAAGYATGNAELMAEGAKDAAKGAAKTAKAGQRAADAGTKVDAARQQKTEQKKALSQGDQGTAKPGQSGTRPGGQSGHAKPAKTGAPSRAASPAKQDARVSSTVNAVGGASTVLNKGGDMRVNATQKGAQAPKQSPKLAAQLDKLGRQQAALKQAEKQVLATGKATLPNGKVVRNVADVRQMQRSLAQKSKAVRSGVEHASTVASLGAAKKLTDKKKKDDDSFF